MPDDILAQAKFGLPWQKCRIIENGDKIMCNLNIYKEQLSTLLWAIVLSILDALLQILLNIVPPVCNVDWDSVDTDALGT